jgi:radical SAM superfamily enzyme YgiQ (UPF0313 family)
MNKSPKILLLNLPGLPHQRLWRDTAGGFGTAIMQPSSVKQSGETSLHPFFPYASSLLLHAGYEFNALDCQRLRCTKIYALREVTKENPDIIIAIISLPSLRDDLEILREIKEHLQNVTIVGVGTVCRVITRDVLLNSPVDVVLRNSYPYTSNLIDLIHVLTYEKNLNDVSGISYKKGGTVIDTPETVELGEFTDLPQPNYDRLPLEGYETISDVYGQKRLYVPLLESKGCSYGCIYCPYPLGFGTKLMFRPLNDLIDEMEFLNLTYNIKAFLLRGQSFSYNRKRAIAICEEIIRRNLDIMWFCESRVDEVSKNYLRLMEKAGCMRIHYGVETGDSETLKIAKPGVVLGTTKKAFKLTKEAGMLTQAHIVLGLPDDNRKTLENTHNFILALDPDFINLNFLTPYPGTKMYELAKEANLILTNDWSNYTSHKVVMRTKTLNTEQLYAIKKRIIRDFSKQKLKQLFQQEFTAIKNPKQFLNKVMNLVNEIVYPQD